MCALVMCGLLLLLLLPVLEMSKSEEKGEKDNLETRICTRTPQSVTALRVVCMGPTLRI